ncbi:hypothetical protein JTB14_024091 [Gonioctena quinquepunctata]|nr:hypothetical protein JTB14_024091 [Gonioctena quinquepunctata]
MDPELRALLRACTVTRWGERRFWEKLRYAMPDVINNARRDGARNQRRSGVSPTKDTPLRRLPRTPGTNITDARSQCCSYDSHAHPEYLRLGGVVQEHGG